MNTRTYLAIATFCLALCTTQTAFAQSSRKVNVEEATLVIRNFYKAYLSNMLSETNAAVDETPEQQYLTPALIEKVELIGNETDADPIIRAQDVMNEMLQTLRVTHLENRWFMVSYETPEKTQIPVRVIPDGNSYRIDYITPLWDEAMYGEAVMPDDNPPLPKVVTNGTAEDFVHSFYKMYTTLHIQLTDKLQDKLSAVRNKYLTPAALQNFQQAADESIEDGRHDFDLLIQGFVFDPLWIPTISVTQTVAGYYKVEHRKMGETVGITLKVKKRGNSYRIDRLVEEE
ncbi:MAG: DUF3828 domain-containing protein [Mediterranea sp.]|jgi:hypothetical protein|nr:DUF3828 domain-containing protein [Mediterranea sp.]